MKKMIYTVVASVAAAASLGAAPTPATASGCGYTVNTTVHLRSGPGTTYASWGLLRKGDAVTEPLSPRLWWGHRRGRAAPASAPKNSVTWIMLSVILPGAPCGKRG